MKVRTLKTINLFCGSGGNNWGARESGIKIFAGFDIWQLVGDILPSNLPGARYYPGDLSRFSHAGILRMKEEISERLPTPILAGMHSQSNACEANPKNEKACGPRSTNPPGAR